MDKLFILNLTKNTKHFFVRCSYTDRNISSTIANLFRIGIQGISWGCMR